MARNKGNRPLMIYTSLIFVVAIIMVVVAFFGQRHLESTQIQQHQTASSISEKASLLSDENRLLMEANAELETENEKLKTDNDNLTKKNTALSKEMEMEQKLREAYVTLANGSKNKALNLLKEIYSEDLTADQKELYDLLIKKCE
ncbi:MAG: hypothetical protein Q4B31_04095 [Clostridia bacterium]|nr:hypothetical protein [Clostridia bacterium]